MICPPPSIEGLKRREKSWGLMSVEMHKVLGAVKLMKYSSKSRAFLSNCETEKGILDEDGFMLCKICETMSLRIMWEFRGHGVR